jgi:hypothetical protein
MRVMSLCRYIALYYSSLTLSISSSLLLYVDSILILIIVIVFDIVITHHGNQQSAILTLSIITLHLTSLLFSLLFSFLFSSLQFPSLHCTTLQNSSESNAMVSRSEIHAPFYGRLNIYDISDIIRPDYAFI